MESPRTGQTPSLDSLRTVEFRQTLRGYHIDDVDEYLERVAVEAEALQEQMRQTSARMKQATERITILEKELTERPEPGGSPSSQETLQRTLMLAQKVIDETQSDAEARAHKLMEEAQQKASSMIAEAENRSKEIADDTEKRLREEIAWLENTRSQLASDVENVARHIESERARLRSALGEILNWVDEHVRPAPAPVPPSTLTGASEKAPTAGGGSDRDQLSASDASAEQASSTPAASPPPPPPPPPPGRGAHNTLGGLEMAQRRGITPLGGGAQRR